MILNTVRLLIIPLLTCVLISFASAQSEPIPSEQDSLSADTTSIDDSVTVDSSLANDTLTAAQRMLSDFETRYRERQSEIVKEAPVRFSFSDTLASYFLSRRLNQRKSIQMSFVQDAGDYFRFDPSFFMLKHEATPMRKTIQPFGLVGQRLDVIYKDFNFSPFEHIPEPDGLIDLYDIPTALNQDVYIIPGAAGQLFGAKQSIAAMVTRPAELESYEPVSGLLVDKGSGRYSYARGYYSKLFTSGKRIDFSIGYRTTDGRFLGHTDQAYQYFIDGYFPLNSTYAVRAVGQVYDREGLLAVRPHLSSGGSLQARERFDRKLNVTLFRNGKGGKSASRLELRHTRQGSYLAQVYRAHFDKRSFGGTAGYSLMNDNAAVDMSIETDWLEYRYSPNNDIVNRLTGAASLTAFTLGDGYRLGLKASQKMVERYRFLPSVAVVAFKESETFFMLGSVGYSERAPSLHELNLPFQEASVYGSSGKRYVDKGNSDLQTEKQLTGSAEMELGPEQMSIGLRVTGGRIFDGIDWLRTGTDTVLFSPGNGDVTFVTVTGRNWLRLSDFLKFQAGGSYHYVDYERQENRAYTPEYQTFTGLELHLFWRSKLIDLYLYGEVSYIGPYDGYERLNIGNYVSSNAQLAFRMSKFRFHYIFGNALSKVIEARDGFLDPGRYNTWGFTWDFLD